MGWSTFWAIFSKTHPVTLVTARLSELVNKVLCALENFKRL
jgi:hypothetical protein